MTAGKTNRSHRIVYMVVLLAFGVALTTVLVLAGERSGREANGSTQRLRLARAAVGEQGC